MVCDLAEMRQHACKTVFLAFSLSDVHRTGIRQFGRLIERLTAIIEI